MTTTTTESNVDLKALKPDFRKVTGWELIVDKDWQTRKALRPMTGIVHLARSGHLDKSPDLRLATEAERAKDATWRHCTACQRMLDRAEAERAAKSQSKAQKGE